MLALVLASLAGLAYATRPVWLEGLADARHWALRQRRGYGPQGGDDAAADDVRLIRLESGARVSLGAHQSSSARLGGRASPDADGVWDAVEGDRAWGGTQHGAQNGGSAVGGTNEAARPSHEAAS